MGVIVADELKVEDKDGKVFSITNIPAGLVDKVNARASSMYPGEDAPWMHLVLDTFLSMADTDQAVFQMTGIPPAALARLEDRCREVEYGDGGDVGAVYAMFSVLLQAAETDFLEIGRLHTSESMPASSVSVVITGIPQKAWQSMEALALQIGDTPSSKHFFGDNQPSAIGFIMGLLEQAHKQALTFTASKPSTTAKSAASTGGVQRGKFRKQ